jgi:hypothetical protein
MVGEAVACGTYKKYEQTDLLQAYIRRTPPHIQDITYTFLEKKGLHISISF